ncbi:hypothetical protein BD560DRAFT_338351, partial [Blakeslea trispora]
MCEFVNFDEQEKIDELSVLLVEPALNWFINTDRSSWAVVKRLFLLQFGGGEDLALVAHKELERVKQGKMSMKQFGPLITDLLERAQIYRPSLQLEYFKKRINNELLRAMIYRGPKTLVDAINITTAVEEDLQRVSLNATAPITPPITYAASSSGSSASTTLAQQNMQQASGYHNRASHRGRSRFSGQRQGRKEHDKPSDETRTCFQCGKRGHLRRNCRQRKMEHSQSQDIAPVEHEDDIADLFVYLGKPTQNTQVTRNVGSSTRYQFLKEVQLEDDRKQDALIDTGATISSLSKDLAEKWNLY